MGGREYPGSSRPLCYIHGSAGLHAAEHPSKGRQHLIIGVERAVVLVLETCLFLFIVYPYRIIRMARVCNYTADV